MASRLLNTTMAGMKKSQNFLTAKAQEKERVRAMVVRPNLRAARVEKEAREANLPMTLLEWVELDLQQK